MTGKNDPNEMTALVVWSESTVTLLLIPYSETDSTPRSISMPRSSTEYEPTARLLMVASTLPSALGKKSRVLISGPLTVTRSRSRRGGAAAV